MEPVDSSHLLERLERSLLLIEQYQIEIANRDDLEGFCSGEWFRDEAIYLAEEFADATGDDRFARRFRERFQIVMP